MKRRRNTRLRLWNNSVPAFAAILMLLGSTPGSHAATSITIDDFNVNEGHFTSNPSTGSGSSRNIAASSTADRVTDDGPREGAGHQKLVLNTTTPDSSATLRHLSGGGSPANNVRFTTSDGEDGWIGFYVKTTNSGWTAQIWLEGPTSETTNSNGSVPKDVVADGEWHLYEWNLDDFSGGADGWGPITGIWDGSPTVANVSHSIDSIILRNPAAPASSVLYIDFLAKSASGSVSNLLANPCINTPGVLVSGPLGTNSTEVTVNGAVSNATAITVYQNSGSGMVQVGKRTIGITNGENKVAVSGLVKAAEVVATQTVNGQESCMPFSGIFVGTGQNPPVRLAVTIRETSSTGPIGSAGDTASINLHFLGAATVSGGAPIDAAVVYPSNDWQTLTFEYKLVGIEDVLTHSFSLVNGPGYAANDYTSLQILAYKTLGGIKVFSTNAAYTMGATSNDVFGVQWTWGAVAGADGYRLLRSLNYGVFDHYVDVPTNSYLDKNTTNWLQSDSIAVTPTVGSTTPAVQWNGPAGTVGTQNAIATPWGILESINFALYDRDSGPFDLYIDSIQNGDTVFQTFEEGNAGTGDYGFRAPSFSGTTSSALLSVPDVGQVSNLAAYEGTNSFRVAFQWNGTNATKWLRLTTAGVGNPQVDLSKPISFKLLLRPASAAPTAPGKLSYSLSGNDLILNWTGSFYLQSATSVNGTYTDLTGRITGPYTNAITSGTKFFRLRN